MAPFHLYLGYDGKTFLIRSSTNIDKDQMSMALYLFAEAAAEAAGCPVPDVLKALGKIHANLPE